MSPKQPALETLAFDSAIGVTVASWEAAIVAVGNFNPPLFSPWWLESVGLIGAGDKEQALASEGMGIVSELCKYSTDAFAIQVLSNQFSVESRGPVTHALLDLVSGIFSIARHTPVAAVGVNFTAHLKFHDLKTYHAFGDAVAPKEIWQKISFGPAKSFGLENLTIVSQPFKRDEEITSGSRQRMIVQPSGKAKPGVLLGFNDHHDLKAEFGSSAEPAGQMADLLNKIWAGVANEAVHSFQQLVLMALKKK